MVNSYLSISPRCVGSMLLTCLLLAAPGQASESSQLHELALRADGLMRLGVIEKGASRAFEKAAEVVEEMEARLAKADLAPEERKALELEIEALRSDLNELTQLYEERFFGAFPLARLTVQTLWADEGFVISEQMYHAPDVAAVVSATKKVVNLLDEYHHPQVVVRSSPTDRTLEVVLAEELLRDGRSTPHNRRRIGAALGADGLKMFDRGELTPEFIDELAKALDTVSLLVLTIGRGSELNDAQTRSIHGDYYQPGDVIQGSPVDAALFLRVESFDFLGTSRDRRKQFRPIIATQLLLLAAALLWARQVKWSLGASKKLFIRLVFGAALFLFGKVFAILAVVILLKYLPDASDMALAALWWPATLGLLLIVGGGLFAWVAQARLTNVVPGARGARAVGSIFALVTLGSTSHFVAPALLLDQAAGFATFVPFLIASVSLAVVFAFAARTGPPVPHYFAVGPVFVAPLVGMAFMAASPALLWLTVALTGALSLMAWVRHKVALAGGTEEPEPTPEDAAEADREMLDKLSKKLPTKL